MSMVRRSYQRTLSCCRAIEGSPLCGHRSRRSRAFTSTVFTGCDKSSHMYYRGRGAVRRMRGTSVVPVGGVTHESDAALINTLSVLMRGECTSPAPSGHRELA
jgi:hypothetical protein